MKRCVKSWKKAGRIKIYIFLAGWKRYELFTRTQNPELMSETCDFLHIAVFKLFQTFHIKPHVANRTGSMSSALLARASVRPEPGGYRWVYSKTGGFRDAMVMKLGESDNISIRIIWDGLKQ